MGASKRGKLVGRHAHQAIGGHPVPEFLTTKVLKVRKLKVPKRWEKTAD